VGPGTDSSRGHWCGRKHVGRKHMEMGTDRWDWAQTGGTAAWDRAQTPHARGVASVNIGSACGWKANHAQPLQSGHVFGADGCNIRRGTERARTGIGMGACGCQRGACGYGGGGYK
jgi:hypothetical protein